MSRTNQQSPVNRYEQSSELCSYGKHMYCSMWSLWWCLSVAIRKDLQDFWHTTNYTCASTYSCLQHFRIFCRQITFLQGTVWNWQLPVFIRGIQFQLRVLRRQSPTPSLLHAKRICNWDICMTMNRTPAHHPLKLLHMQSVEECVYKQSPIHKEWNVPQAAKSHSKQLLTVVVYNVCSRVIFLGVGSWSCQWIRSYRRAQVRWNRLLFVRLIRCIIVTQWSLPNRRFLVPANFLARGKLTSTDIHKQSTVHRNLGKETIFSCFATVNRWLPSTQGCKRIVEYVHASISLLCILH